MTKNTMVVENVKPSSRKEKALAASRKADEAGQRLVARTSYAVGYVTGTVKSVQVVKAVTTKVSSFVEIAKTNFAEGESRGLTAHEERVVERLAKKESTVVTATVVGANSK